MPPAASALRRRCGSQEVRVQERLQCLDAGSVPSAISVLLLDEMADTCQAGGAQCWQAQGPPSQRLPPSLYLLLPPPAQPWVALA